MYHIHNRLKVTCYTNLITVSHHVYVYHVLVHNSHPILVSNLQEKSLVPVYNVHQFQSLIFTVQSLYKTMFMVNRNKLNNKQIMFI